jgi:NAD(P)H-flavin reductase
MVSLVENERTLSPESDPMLPRRYQVRRVRRENADTFTMELAAADQSGRVSFAPGQFNMLYVFGVGEAPISICGKTRNGLEHTTRTVGTVTSALSRLRRGDVVGVRGPYGSCWPLAETAGRDVVLVAGGIGLAPLRSALQAIVAQREIRRRVTLIFGVRTAEDMLYRQELERLRDRGLQLYVTVNRATGSWHGNVGVVTSLIPRVPFDPLNCVAMVCGPELMMRFSIEELTKRGVPEQRIFLSLERNMKCAVGFCGHCQFGPEFLCKDGPIFRCDRIRRWINIAEL